MTRRENAKQKVNQRLDVERVMGDFRRDEESPSHRKGTFKIDKPFEEALDTILRATSKPKVRKPEPRRS